MPDPHEGSGVSFLPNPCAGLLSADIDMPVMGRLELLRRIRESERLADLPVILCSGNDDRAIMQKAWEYRCVKSGS
jgi:CheY-like chemotaxis protein